MRTGNKKKRRLERRPGRTQGARGAGSVRSAEVTRVSGGGHEVDGVTKPHQEEPGGEPGGGGQAAFWSDRQPT